MAQHATEFSITSTDVRAALLSAFRIRRPVFLWGQPGIGKSEVVESITNELGGLMIDLRMAQLDPTDIRGIPYYNKEENKMDWAEPIDLPTEEQAKQYNIVVLFLDEMNSAAPAVQASAYQLILNRRVGRYVLPENVVIVAAGNRESDKGVTYRMPLPLANRFIHLEMRHDFTSWQNWAVTNGIHQDVVGYLSFAKQDANDFDSKSVSRAFATPRTWTFVSQLLHDADNPKPMYPGHVPSIPDEKTLSTLIAGTIGEGLAVKFMAHRRVASKMPNPYDILIGKETKLNTDEISAKYSLTVSMCYELRDALMSKKVDTKQYHEMFDNFLKFMMDNFETELNVMGAKIALKTYQLPVNHDQLKNFSAFHKKFGKYVIEAGNA